MDQILYPHHRIYESNLRCIQRNFNFAVKALPQDEMADFEYELVGEMRKIRQAELQPKRRFSINKMDTLERL